ncbi:MULTISPECIES: hypothetical protein [unclassified Burkholderia]|uniref:hypothetical protein n=1 Tax=unclassified Burkholderia TaxID=2613784 RepID=UPI0012E3927D|nr:MULTISPECIES: hypothetical protein [unclassified Burkholderia]
MLLAAAAGGRSDHGIRPCRAREDVVVLICCARLRWRADLRGLPTGAVAGVWTKFSNIRANLSERGDMRGATPRATEAGTHAAAGTRRTRCRIDVHRAPSSRTAMSHGDSAAAHHICAWLHRDASRAAPRSHASGAPRALCDGAARAIRVDMAWRLRELVRADQRRFVRSTDYRRARKRASWATASYTSGLDETGCAGRRFSFGG